MTKRPRTEQAARPLEVARKVERRLSVCCVYYAKGSWDTAETIMYPNIVTKGPGQTTLQELMDADLARFRKDNPGISHVDGDMPFNDRTAKVRYFTASTRVLRKPLPTSTKKMLSSKTEKPYRCY